MTLTQQAGGIPGFYKVLTAGSNTVLGHAGQAGDYLESITITASTTTPGATTVTDGNGTGAVTVLSIPAGTATVLPYTVTIPIRAYATNTATTLTNQGWNVTLGASNSGFAVGQFS